MPVTRREILKSAAALTAFPLTAQLRDGAPIYAYVGSYTTAERAARGDGIHVYRMNSATGAWTHVQHVGSLVNPSYLILSKDQRFLYSVHGDEAYATSFAVDGATGMLTLLNRAATGGSNGVHQAIDPSGKFMIVANYGSGTVAVLPVQPDGSLADQTQLVPLPGKPGPHRVEQPNSRPHHIVFDPSGKFVLVPDKGLDRVFIFRFDPSIGKLTPTAQGSVSARSGSGPRHLAFHPSLPIVFVLNELASTVTTYKWDLEKGSLQPLQLLPTLPPNFTAENTAAEIVVSANGRHVYTSNRGHDSIAVFTADPQSGLLKSLSWVSTQGKRPRFIAFDPSQRYLYAANEQGDTIVTFRVNSTSGALTPSGQPIANASPVAIAFRISR
jgi:6-phosphogluconolactonase